MSTPDHTSPSSASEHWQCRDCHFTNAKWGAMFAHCAATGHSPVSAKVVPPSSASVQSQAILARAHESMAKELFRLRTEAARIEADRARRLKRAEWLDLWSYDAARDVFTTDRGDMLAGAAVREDGGSAWPFIKAWYNAYPEERSRV